MYSTRIFTGSLAAMLSVTFSSSLTCLKPNIYQSEFPRSATGIDRSPVEELVRLQFRPVGDFQLAIDPEFCLA